MKSFEELLKALEVANQAHINACRELALMRADGGTPAQIRVQVNLCRKKFLERALAEIELFEHPELK